MFARLDQISLRARLALGFLLMILLIFTASGSAGWSHRYTIHAIEKFFDKEDKIDDLSFKGSAALLAARRYEKEFLLKVKEFGYEETRARYVTQVRVKIVALRESMNEIQTVSSDPNDVREAQAIAKVAARYEAGFLKVAELYGRLGRVDTGLEGQFRTHAHAIEVLLDQGASDRLMVDLLAMRRAEKDFIVRNLVKHVAAYEAAASRFRQDVRLSALSEPRKTQLLQLAEQYRAFFKEYVAVKAEIDADTLAYLSTVNVVEPMLQRFHERSEEAAKTTRETVYKLSAVTTSIVMISGLATLLLGVLVAAFISRNINRTVREGVNFASKLAAGDLSTRLRPLGRNEFGTLANALNAMATQIAEDIHNRERVEAELANRTEALAHSFSLLNATLESTADGILATQFSSGVNCANTKFRSMWGIPPEMLERGVDTELIAFMAPQTMHPEQFIARFNELVANPDHEYFDVIELQDGRTFERYCQPQRIEGKTEGLVVNFRDITERRRVERELKNAHQQLVATARQAGMAEIAVNVLHNVGNVLNSVNVSANLVSSRVRSSKAKGLSKAVQLLNERAADLGEFLTRDEKGKLLPDYLNKVAEALAAEQQGIIEELGQLTKSVDHIKEIVSAQQSHAGASRVVEAVQIRDLIEDALRMNSFSFSRHRIEVVKKFADVPVLRLDKARVLQILVNLIRNAKQAMDGVGGRPHQMTLRVEVTDERKLRICVQDQGEGIAAENLTRIFAHGFTTRKDGHGFGLHSCVLAAKEMGGSLMAHSDGPGTGATFTLELPIMVEEETL